MSFSLRRNRRMPALRNHRQSQPRIPAHRGVPRMEYVYDNGEPVGPAHNGVCRRSGTDVEQLDELLLALEGSKKVPCNGECRCPMSAPGQRCPNGFGSAYDFVPHKPPGDDAGT